MGQTKPELVGQNAFDFLAPSWLTLGAPAWLPSCVPGNLAVGRELEGDRTYDSQIYPVLDTAGRVVRAAIYARDITERKQMEAELRKTRDELASLLALSGELVSTLELEPLLDLILEKLASVVSYDHACILTLTGDALQVQAHRGYEPATDFSELRMSRRAYR